MSKVTIESLIPVRIRIVKNKIGQVEGIYNEIEFSFYIFSLGRPQFRGYQGSETHQVGRRGTFSDHWA